MNIMVPFLWVAGGVHLVIAVSNVWVPGILHYRENIARLSPMVRQVFIVHSIYLVLVLLGFGALCLFYAPQLAGGAPLARSWRSSGFFAWDSSSATTTAACGRSIAWETWLTRWRSRSLGIVFTLTALGVGR